VVTTSPFLKILDGDTQREISFRLQAIYRMPGRVITQVMA